MKLGKQNFLLSINAKVLVLLTLFLFVPLMVFISIFLMYDFSSAVRSLDVLSCVALGGTWKVGWSPWGADYNCYYIYKDGGKKCNTGKDCQSGACVINYSTKENHCAKDIRFELKNQDYLPSCGEFIIDKEGNKKSGPIC